MNFAPDRQVKIDRRVQAKAGTYGAAAIRWELLATVWAERRDLQPGQSEAVREGLETWTRRTRYRIRWRGDLDATMRLRDGDRTLQIVGGPAELGRRDFIDLICEEFTSPGGPA
jgi:head-tail adaptor